MDVRLTQFSHGAGCGCKLSPKVLDAILAECQPAAPDGKLLVGNSSRDDAAVYDIGHGLGLVSTTDFFMPIVDDPYTFGRIAAANAISDVYAMGGRPVLAIGILGWPIEKLAAAVAGRVVEGGRSMCAEAGIALAGGHSIDSPEPIFGLAVNGLVPIEHLKRNDTAEPGDLLLLTKPLGIGVLTTAEKRGVLAEGDVGLAAKQMTTLNRVGEALGAVRAVNAMTDVTGFGLLGHLREVCGARLSARIELSKVPRLPGVERYVGLGAVPGGTRRNFESYGERVSGLSDMARAVLCDPQTSGGLLIAVAPEGLAEVQAILRAAGLDAHTAPIGGLAAGDGHIEVAE